MKSQSIIWLNEKFISEQEATIPLQNHSLHYGVGVFEGIRVYQTEKGSVAFRLQEHTDRLLQSAHILNIPVPYSAQTLFQAQQELIRKNGLGNAYLRPFIYYDGDGYIGLHTKNLKTQVAIMALPWNNYLTQEQYNLGIKVITSSLSRYSPGSIYCKAKSTGKYLSTVMALQQATQAGVDDAIFLDQQGLVSEGTGTNIFAVRGNTLITPLTTTALDGITRDTIFVLAKDRGLKIQEKQVLRDELYIADEVFFTGTAAQIVGIIEIDGRRIQTGKIGPITQWLMRQYDDCVQGKLPHYAEWLTPI